MYSQIITFTVNEMTDHEYDCICGTLTADCGGVPGLVAQRWSMNAATHIVSGTLKWSVPSAMEEALRIAARMTAYLDGSSVQVRQREFTLPVRAGVRARESFYDPRG